MTEEKEQAPPKVSPRRYSPPIWIWAIVVLSLLVLVAVQVSYRLVDNAPDGLLGDVIIWLADGAYGNIMTFSFTMTPIIWLLGWFIVRSTYPRALRLAPLILLLVAGAAAAATVEIVEVSGNLVPKFKFRWTKLPDENLESTPQQGATVDLTTTTADDYPQFLGPDRNLVLPDAKLSTDWQTTKPKELWRQPIGAGWSGFAAVNGFALTMEQRGDQEMVTCYELSSGKLQWSHAVETRHKDVIGGDGPRCTPTIYGGKVYALGATGILRCLEGGTGQLLWSHNLTEMYNVASHDADLSQVAWGRSASPLVYDDLVVVPAGGPAGGATSLVAFNKEDGSKVWQAGNHQVSYSSPVLAEVDGVRQVIVVSEGLVTGHNPEQGTILWEYPWPSSSAGDAAVSQPIVWTENRILLSKGYGLGGRLIRVSRDGEKWQINELWSNPRVLKTKFTNAAAKDGFVYALSDGILECVEMATGDRRWKGGRFGHGQMLVAGDVILAQAETGELVMLSADPEDRNELGQVDALTGKCWNNLCLSGPYLVTRNAQEAVCYELPTE